MRWGLLFAICFSSLVSIAGAETVNRVAAVVNEEAITTFQLEKQVQERVGTGELPAGEKDRGRRQVLEQMIEDTLIRQRSDELGIKVSDGELNAAVQDVLKQNKLTRPQLEEALLQEGMGMDEYQEKLRQEIVRYKLVSREVQNRAEVTSHEIREYFREHIDEYREPASVRLNRLTFPLPLRADGEQTAAIRGKAEEALARLRRQEDFTAVLLAYSADRSAEGGDMGRLALTDLSGAFERAVRGLRDGEVSDLVETPQAFHILQVAESTAERIRQFDSVKDEIARTLGESKTQARLREWLGELKKKSSIEIRI